MTYNPHTWATGETISQDKLNNLEAGVAANDARLGGLAAVATSGAYADLASKPALATVATSGAYGDLSGRPALATVATSGSYNDLANKPSFRVKDYGAVGDNTTNDTTAIQNCINAAPNGATIWLDAGTYLVDGVTLKTRQTLTGPNNRTYGATSTDGAALAARLSTQTAAVLTLAGYNAVTSIAVYGNTRNMPCVKATAGFNDLVGVTMMNGSIGFHGNYQSGNRLSRCTVMSNNDGLYDILDSHVSECVLASNNNGINLQAGANDNMIVGNKIEWNTNHGISAFQANHVTLAGNLFDRNSNAGLYINACSHWSVGGGVYRRNGRAASGTNFDCHIYQESCTGITVVGCTTMHGKDDDGTNYDSPAYILQQYLGTDVNFSGNDFTGFTTGVLRDLGAGTRRNMINNLGATDTVATAPDATSTTKGVLELAGDLGGTAAAPTVTGGTNHTHTSTQVSDATTLGRSLMTTASAAAARSSLGAAATTLAQNTVTANYTLVAGDATATVLNATAASAITITLPQDSAATIAQETAIPWRQYGAGIITFAAGTGATLVSRGSVFRSAGQYAEGMVTKVAANTWLLSGDIAA